MIAIEGSIPIDRIYQITSYIHSCSHAVSHRQLRGQEHDDEIPLTNFEGSDLSEEETDNEAGSLVSKLVHTCVCLCVRDIRWWHGAMRSMEDSTFGAFQAEVVLLLLMGGF